MMKNASEESDLVVISGRYIVLPGVNASVRDGSVTGLLGPSGCGKSTLLRSIVWTQRGRSGSVTVLCLAAAYRERRSRVGYVTQAPSVYADLPVPQYHSSFATHLDVDGAAVIRVLPDYGL